MRLPFLILVVYVDCKQGSFSEITGNYQKYTEETAPEQYPIPVNKRIQKYKDRFAA